MNQPTSPGTTPMALPHVPMRAELMAALLDSRSGDVQRQACLALNEACLKNTANSNQLCHCGAIRAATASGITGVHGLASAGVISSFTASPTGAPGTQPHRQYKGWRDLKSKESPDLRRS